MVRVLIFGMFFGFGLFVVSAQSVHIVAPGDTLFALSRRYDVPLDLLLDENGITNPATVPIGTALKIPKGLIDSDENNMGFYRVMRGDTYYSIAGQYQMTVSSLLTQNKRTANDVLHVDEVLRVKAVGTSSKPLLTTTDAVMVDGIPQWPVKGLKKSLQGKLAGVSIMSDPLSYVYAVVAGNVVWTGPYRGFGNVVLVDSGEYIFLYGGNEDLFVNVGQTVQSGSRIGRLGAPRPEQEKREMFFSVFKEGEPVPPESIRLSK